jgi:hypothetical protein
MKKSQILVFVVILSLALGGLSFTKKDTNAAKRGKVVADDRSGLFNLKLDEASIFSLSSLADSTDIISGEICVLGSNNESTGEYIEMVPRKFPKWFLFGCDEDGTIITYKIVNMGNGDSKALVKFSKKQKRGPSQE